MSLLHLWKTEKTMLDVIELFAGVGGFRLGLEGWDGNSASSRYQNPSITNFRVIWSNQWEPSTKTQHASMIYEEKFGKSNHSNTDITSIDVANIPDHDLLVGGFPCQDYSVATTLKNSKGLLGKKGVLWWSIHRILSEKVPQPSFLLLENVDRLLISPAKQRGRDFAIMLKSLNDLGYAVEWRVINSAEYGMPQRRKRIFILGYLQGTCLYEGMKESSPIKWLLEGGPLASAFPVRMQNGISPKMTFLNGDILHISENFNKDGKSNNFENTGMMIDGKVISVKTLPDYNGERFFLKDIIHKGEVEGEFYIDDDELEKWIYLKGSKKEMRKSASGYEYQYTEGAMLFPDDIYKPSRTVITGEGGKSASRFKHVIKTPEGLRRLTPLELERLNMFPDNFTLVDKITNSRRAFLMGNAIVVGIVERIGMELSAKISYYKAAA